MQYVFFVNTLVKQTIQKRLVSKRLKVNKRGRGLTIRSEGAEKFTKTNICLSPFFKHLRIVSLEQSDIHLYLENFIFFEINDKINNKY